SVLIWVATRLSFPNSGWEPDFLIRVICGSLVASSNRTRAGNFALNLWIAGIFDLARAGDGDFQVVAHRDSGVARTGDGNLGRFRLQGFSTQVARAGQVRD